MTHRNVVFICLFVLSISSLSALARADERYTVSEHAEPLKPQADKALVYFVVQRFGGIRAQKLYIDKHPIGVLPGGSYTATLVEPGLRLIWGSQRGEWFEFKPGKAYLLQTMGISAEWFLQHPAAIAGVEKSKKLKYVKVTEAGLEKLREKLDDNYDKSRRQAGDPIPLTLPISFEIAVAVSKPGAEKQGGLFGTAGTLTIEETRIRFASKKANKLSFDIPMEDVYGVKLLGVQVQDKVLDIGNRRADSQSAIFTRTHGSVFMNAHSEPFGDYNRRFQAIMKALEGRPE